MAVLPRDLHTTLVSPEFAAPVVTVAAKFTESSDADATVKLFAATRKMRLIRATYIQSVDATAVTSYVATLNNGATTMTNALNIKALSNDVVADFVVKTTADAVLKKGDRLSVVFDETGGTATSPEVVDLLLEFQLLE
jgi:hypothetical protein